MNYSKEILLRAEQVKQNNNYTRFLNIWWKMFDKKIILLAKISDRFYERAFLP